MTGVRADLSDEGLLEPTQTPEERMEAIIAAEEAAGGPPSKSPEGDVPLRRAAPVEDEYEEDDEVTDEEDIEEDGTTAEPSDDEESEEIAPTDQEELEDVYEVPMGQETLEVPVSELIKRYGQESTFTRKSQQLAENAKAFEEEQTAVRAERARYSQLLTQLEDTVQQTMPQEPDVALRGENPGEYAAQMEDYRRRNDHLRQLQTERSALTEREQYDQQQRMVEHMRVEGERLKEAIPEWNDTKKMTEDQGTLVDYLQGYGYTPNEIGMVADHRAIVMARKAMLYDKLQEAKPRVVKRAKRAPTAKPGSSKGRKPKGVNKLVASRKRLAKSGSLDDAQDFFFEALKREEG